MSRKLNFHPLSLINAPIHCFEQVIIFNKWKSRFLLEQEVDLLFYRYFSDHNNDLLVLNGKVHQIG